MRGEGESELFDGLTFCVKVDDGASDALVLPEARRAARTNETNARESAREEEEEDVAQKD